MRKFYSLAAAAFMALAANAQNGAPLYAVGNGDGLDWTPGTPTEFAYADGAYTLDVADLTQFKISTTMGTWDDFNDGAYGCVYGDEPGVPMILEAGNDQNIMAPWKGDYTITVAGDLSTITLTTTTPKPSDDVITPVYLRGGMNTWSATEEWQMEGISKTLYKFVCSEEQTIPEGESFKFADADWNAINVGGSVATDIFLDMDVTVINGNSSQNLTMQEDWNGVCWLTLDYEGAAYAVFSNDKDYVPDWAGGTPVIPDDPDEPVVPGKLYITGGGDFTNGAWNAAQPDEFTYADGKYTFEVTNLSMFKISTTYDPEATQPWDAFNEGVYGCEYGDEPGVAMALIAGFDENMKTPWIGDYTITVAGDLSTITLTTTTPKPDGTVSIYLRGDMSGWQAEEEWKMTPTSDENIYKFVCADDQVIEMGDSFKIADADWYEVNIGAKSDDYIVLDTTTEVEKGGINNMMLEEDWNGVCWLNLDVNGAPYVVFSNDKEFVPEWGGNTPDEPVYEGKLYITGAGEFENGSWNPVTPDEFTFADDKFTIKVNNLSSFKISTTCDPEASNETGEAWKAFDKGVRGCAYGEEPGVEVALEEGYTMDIRTPWVGDYTITVAGNLSTIILTTDTPKPEGPVAIYLRGDMNGWAAEEAWQMTPTSDENVYKFVCTDEQSVTAGDMFKIADAEWYKINLGSVDGEALQLDATTELNKEGINNLYLDEDWNGVCWLNLDVDGAAYVVFSNDKDFVPEWGGNTPDDPVYNGPLYITGAGEFENGSWNPGTPDQFTFADGKFTIEVNNLSMFKISTTCDAVAEDPWDAFNEGVYGCDYGDEPGVEVALEKGYFNNIKTPWTGDYTITVAADLSTITLTTNTPKPEGPMVLYLRGSMNDWDADEAWAMTATSDENVYKFVCAEDQAIEFGDAFKIADAGWSKVNIGGVSVISLDKNTEVLNGNNPINMSLEEDWNGVCWLNLDVDGAPYVVFSNDKEFVPDWTVTIPDDPDDTDPLYITGAGDFANGAWNPVTPDRFTFADGNYTIKVNNLSSFKISTTCDPEASNETGEAWKAFDEGVRGCVYGDEPGVEVELIEGYTMDIRTPWVGDYTITVSADLSTITLTTDTPKPEGPVTLYLRGDMNEWTADEAWKMTVTEDENVYKFVCAEDQSVEAGVRFKIADFYWTNYIIGSDGEPISLGEMAEVIKSDNPDFITPKEDWNGVLWLNLDFKGQAYIILSNDKTFVPDWEALGGVSNVEISNNGVKYFNLQGVQVANPESGLYIEIRNGESRKVMIK